MFGTRDQRLTFPNTHRPLSANRVCELALDLDNSVRRNEMLHLRHHCLKRSFPNASVMFTYKMNSTYPCNTVFIKQNGRGYNIVKESTGFGASPSVLQPAMPVAYGSVAWGSSLSLSEPQFPPLCFVADNTYHVKLLSQFNVMCIQTNPSAQYLVPKKEWAPWA